MARRVTIPLGLIFTGLVLLVVGAFAAVVAVLSAQQRAEFTDALHTRLRLQEADALRQVYSPMRERSRLYRSFVRSYEDKANGGPLGSTVDTPVPSLDATMATAFPFYQHFKVLAAEDPLLLGAIFANRSDDSIVPTDPSRRYFNFFMADSRMFVRGFEGTTQACAMSTSTRTVTVAQCTANALPPFPFETKVFGYGESLLRYPRTKHLWGTPLYVTNPFFPEVILQIAYTVQVRKRPSPIGLDQMFYFPLRIEGLLPILKNATVSSASHAALYTQQHLLDRGAMFLLQSTLSLPQPPASQNISAATTTEAPYNWPSGRSPNADLNAAFWAALARCSTENWTAISAALMSPLISSVEEGGFPTYSQLVDNRCGADQPIVFEDGPLTIAAARLTTDDHLDLMLVQHTPTAHFYGPSDRARLQGILIGVAAAAAVVICCILTLVAVWVPMRALQKGMDLAAAMRNDEVEALNPVLTELHHLAAAFAEMNERLLLARPFLPQSLLVRQVAGSSSQGGGGACESEDFGGADEAGLMFSDGDLLSGGGGDDDDEGDISDRSPPPSFNVIDVRSGGSPRSPRSIEQSWSTAFSAEGSGADASAPHFIIDESPLGSWRTSHARRGAQPQQLPSQQPTSQPHRSKRHHRHRTKQQGTGLDSAALYRELSDGSPTSVKAREEDTWSTHRNENRPSEKDGEPENSKEEAVNREHLPKGKAVSASRKGDAKTTSAVQPQHQHRQDDERTASSLSSAAVVAATLVHRRVAVLVVNVRGFAAATHSMLPCGMAGMQRRVAEQVAQSAAHHRGLVDAFHGDRFVCTFNTVRLCGAPSRSACAAAVALEQVLSSDLVLAGVFPNGLSMGMSGGRALVGNMGTATMQRLSVVGPAFREAHALEEIMCRGVLSEERLRCPASHLAPDPSSTGARFDIPDIPAPRGRCLITGRAVTDIISGGACGVQVLGAVPALRLLPSVNLSSSSSSAHKVAATFAAAENRPLISLHATAFMAPASTCNSPTDAAPPTACAGASATTADALDAAACSGSRLGPPIVVVACPWQPSPSATGAASVGRGSDALHGPDGSEWLYHMESALAANGAATAAGNVAMLRSLLRGLPPVGLVEGSAIQMIRQRLIFM